MSGLVGGVMASPAIAQPLAAAAAPATATHRVLIQRVEAIAVKPRLARALEEALVLEVGQRRGVRVVSPAEMEHTLKFARLQAELGCDYLDECMAEVRDKLDVEQLIVGKLSKLGSSLVMTFARVDLQNANVARRATREAADFRGLRAELAGAVDELLGATPRKARFRMPEGSELSLAVMPLIDRGVKASTAAAMTQILSAELNQVRGVKVISQDDIRALLRKVEIEGELGCTENLDCIVEIGAALGLSKLVTGSVGKLGSTHVVSLQLVDTRAAEVQSRVLEAFDGSADELRNAVKLLAYQLIGVAYDDRAGGVDFSFNVDEAQVLFGTRRIQLRDNRLGLGGLSPGRYSLRILPDPDDYHPLQTDVYVAPDATNVRTFALVEKPDRWYESWWFWTAIGAGAAAVAVTALAIAGDSDDFGKGTVTVQ